MHNYQPEILMGLILSLTCCLVLRARPTVQPIAPEPVLAKLAQAEEPAFDAVCALRLLRDGAVEQVSLHDYLVGVLLSEVPMTFDMEALKAQAIASRTYALHCRKHDTADVCADSGCCQAWRDDAAQRERFGDDYSAYYEKARRAVESTDGMVITYGGELIDATFFACSGGRTEDALAVWGSEVPYLRAVDSPGEEAASCFYSQNTLNPADFAGQLPEADLSGDPAGWLGAARLTSGGGVEEITIGGVAYRGTELRQRFGLKSARFDLRYEDGTFAFDVTGYGHRVGMSQYGAQAMAQAGATVQEIIQTYYTGVTLETLTAR